MQPKIGVVGVGGVGMAHVIAAKKLNWNVSWLVDTDQEVRERCREGWRNEWLFEVEEVPVQPDTLVFGNVREVPEHQAVDVVVIATPPHTHMELVADSIERGIARTIIVEKPCSYPEKGLKLNNGVPVRVSGEWLFSVPMPQRPKTMHMSYPPSNTSSWGYEMPTALDLLPHMFTMLVANGYSVERIVRLTQNSIIVEGTGGRHTVCSWDDKPQFGFWIDQHPVPWASVYFCMQLQQIDRLLFWNDMVAIERKLVDVL